MIISASRRTDIPAFYWTWFENRIREGYVLVRNPRNPHQVSKISLSPDVVDGIVFWTKNPTPMLDKLSRLKDYMYYFQFTLNAYGRDAEPYVPSKNDVVIPAFQKLSDSIGPDRVIWRYDPIFLSSTYTPEYHLRCFAQLAKRLSPYTKSCTISFLDYYRNTAKNMEMLHPAPFPPETKIRLAKGLADIAHSYGLEMDTCAEGIDLEECGIRHGKCIDDRLFAKLLNCPLEVGKDKNQRIECRCMESIDIGAYDTCSHGCRYCYANHSESLLRQNIQKHDPRSPFLAGGPEDGDRITQRKQESCLVRQLGFDTLDR